MDLIGNPKKRRELRIKEYGRYPIAICSNLFVYNNNVCGESLVSFL